MGTVYDMVNEKIMAALEGGTVPWHKPWNGAATAPRNIEGRRYRGINPLLLALAGYEDPRWATFRQIEERGGRIRKDEHGSFVTFWKQLRFEDTKTDPTTGESSTKEKKVPMLRFYKVWNVAAQVEGIELPALDGPEPIAPTPIEAAEAILAGMPNPPEVRYVAGDRAYYTPAMDRITFPKRTQFTSVGGMYQTLFHEHVHSTGHKSRLDRDGITTFDHFGSERYAREELVAEAGAAYLMGEAGLDMDENVPDLASYIEGWKGRIKEDPRALVVAFGKAQHAADYILGRTAADSEPVALAAAA